MTKTIASLLLALAAAAAVPARALAAGSCTNPGKDGPASIGGIVNSYYPGVSGVAGLASVTVGTVDTSSGGSAKAISAGDLLLVIQMQDADLSTSNDSGYGGSSTGSGQIALNNSGVYEYATVAAGFVSGTSIPLLAPLQNSYRSQAYSGGNGQRAFQVIRVPQYSAVTLSGLVTGAPWNGVTGGVVVADVAGVLSWNGQTIDVTARGFRGGGGLYMKGRGGAQPAYAASDYLSTLAPTNPTFTTNPWTTPGPFTGSNASKGEGIAGTPRYLFVSSPLGAATNGAGAILDTGVEGYPNGSLARGAPGNAGGGGTDGDPQTAANGGNDQNTGGGGGGGSAAGGMGGYGWTPGTPPGSQTGGFGGQGVPMSAARLAFGGGGGAGVTNNGTGTPNYGVASSGAAGGGLVFLRAKTISGSGTVNASGASGNPTVCNDASGGGGGGGAVLIFASGNNGNVGTVAVNANGGGGGSNTGNGTGENLSACGAYDNTNPHGPGGGGGGGFVALSSSSNATISVNGGGNGTTTPSPTSTAPYGSSSSPGGFQISSVVSTDIPGASPSPLCFPLLTVTKVTTRPNTVQGGTTGYTITVSNGAAYGTATGVVLADALPAGLNLASTDAVTTAGGATRTTVSNPVAGATSPAWGAFSIPGGGSVSVSFTANVPAATPVGVLQNPASVSYDDPTRTSAGQTVTPGGTYSTGDFVLGSNYNPASSTAEDVNVRQPVVLTVAFSPVSVNAGGAALLIVSVQNPNGVALTSAAFADALPAGLTASGPVTVTGCSGFTPVTLSAGATSFAQGGGTVPANTTCTFSVSVTAASAQSYLDTVPAANFTNALNVTNVAPASATLLSRPTLAKSFAPAAVAPGASATLTFTLVNPNAATPLTGASFSDNLPSPLQAVGGAVTASGGCTGFPAAIAAAATAFNPSGVALPAGATCTVSFLVKSPTAGPYTNTASGVTTTETVAAGAPSNSAQLGVGVIGISKSFAASRIQSGGTTVVTLALTNPSGVAQTNGSFTDTLTGMSVGAVGVGGTCTGTTPSSLSVGQASVAFTGINVPAAGCTVTFTVTSASAGTQTNTTSGVTTALLPAGAPSNTATLVVTAPPTIATSFTPSTIQIGATSVITFTLVNGDSIPLTSAGFTDTLTNLRVSVAGPAGGTCTGASSNSFLLNQTGALSFTGLTVPPGAGGCTVTLPVTAAAVSPAAGYPNTTSGLSSVEAATGPVSNTARLVVAATASIAKAFATSPISQGGTSLLTFTLTNSSNVALTGAGFTDALTNMSINGTGAAGGTCAGASSNSFAAGQTGTLTFSGLTLPAAGNCTVTVTLTSATAGSNSNTASGVTSNETPVAGAGSNTANLVVYSPPQISVGFFPGVILSSAALATSNTTLTLTLSNSNAAALTGVAFTDPLTAMQVFGTGPAGGTCAGAAGNAFTAGATSLSFSGLTVPAGGSCTVTVQISSPGPSPASGWPNSTSGATSTQTPTAGPASPAGYLTVLSYATLQKIFSPSSIGAAGTSTIIFTLTNPNAISLSGASFSDTFPTSPGPMTTTAVAQSYIGGGRGTCTGAIPSAGSAAAASVSFTGLSIPANSSCTVLVDVTAAVIGNYSNTASGVTTSQTGAGAGPASSTATLGVATLGIAKNFAPGSVGVGEKSSLSLVVSNPSVTGYAGTLVLSDSFPAGMSIASPLNATNSCGGTLRNAGNTANSVAGDTGFSLQGGTVAGSASCTITIDVITGGAGSFANTSSAPTSSGVNVGSPSNTATLTVVQKPSISEAFTPPSTDTYKNSLLTFTLTNPNGAALTSCDFTDALAGFAVSSPPSIGGTCTGVTSAPALATSATSLNLTVPSLSSGSCTITVPVTSGAAGTYANAASGVKCSQMVTAGTAAASAQVTFNKVPITLVKTASQLTVPPGSAVTYTITYRNPNGSQALQNIVISDVTPAFTAFTSAACGALPASLTSCSIAAPAVGAAGTVTWTLGGTLDPGATGSVSLTVTVK